MGNSQLRLRTDAEVTAPVVALADFASDTNAAAVRIDPADDVRALLPHLAQLALVEVSFPVFGDGRGYSSARILREAGYTGELRAAGDVAVDQLAAMVRCGFDNFAPKVPMNPADVDAALGRWPHVYQATPNSLGTSPAPIWALRHPAKA